VAERVVDNLETVEIDKKNRELPIVAPRLHQGMVDALHEQTTIG
jgi:hypothetical protein